MLEKPPTLGLAAWSSDWPCDQSPCLSVKNGRFIAHDWPERGHPQAGGRENRQAQISGVADPQEISMAPYVTQRSTANARSSSYLCAAIRVLVDVSTLVCLQPRLLAESICNLGPQHFAGVVGAQHRMTRRDHAVTSPPTLDSKGNSDDTKLPSRVATASLLASSSLLMGGRGCKCVPASYGIVQRGR